MAIVLCSAIASILMGLLSNDAFALGPGTGIVALFACSLVLGMGMDWRIHRCPGRRGTLDGLVGQSISSSTECSHSKLTLGSACRSRLIRCD